MENSRLTGFGLKTVCLQCLLLSNAVSEHARKLYIAVVSNCQRTEAAHCSQRSSIASVAAALHL